MKTLVRFFFQAAYNVGIVTFFLVTAPFFFWRLWRRGRLLAQFGQRFGLYAKDVRAKLKPGADLWVHAVSVGEVAIALVLIRRLREMHPPLRVVVSTTTPTGFARAKKDLEDAQTSIIYNPIDVLWVVRAAFNLIRPRLLVLIESEIWPNYLWCARRRKIPVYLVNARLSRRTEERYRRMARLIRPLLQEISLVFAQDPTDVVRLGRAGFAPESIFNLGSMKYDVAALGISEETEIGFWWDRTGWPADAPVLLGGSTHPGEEEVLVRVYLRLRERWPDLRLVLAPRHAERGAAIRDLCDRMGLRAVTRAQLAAADAAPGNGHTAEVLVVNSTGELRSLYKRATLAFVGKSLRGQGGQNFIEAAPVGTPIIVGPNMQNFEVATREFLRRQAIVQVTDEFELAETLEALFASDDARRELGERARKTFEDNLNAGRRTAEVILRALSYTPAARAAPAEDTPAEGGKGTPGTSAEGASAKETLAAPVRVSD